MLPRLSILIPCRRRDDPDLQRFLCSLRAQTFQDSEVLVETQGDSEEAKAIAASRAQGDLLAFFCADNDVRDPRFLEVMVRYASDPQVTGAYTAQYDYVLSDPPLNRYFALLGANDPLAWFLRKADRSSYMGRSQLSTTCRTFTQPSLPSLGDNGFFIKRTLFEQQRFTPATFGSCMDSCERLRRLGHATYWVVSEVSLWHRTGDSLLGYLRRRYRYARDLYFKKFESRQWRMVSSRRDGVLALLFALASVLVVPQLCVSLLGYRRVRDWSWAFHPLICLSLTCLYTWAVMEHLLRSAWSFAHSQGARPT